MAMCKLNCNSKMAINTDKIRYAYVYSQHTSRSGEDKIEFYMHFEFDDGKKFNVEYGEGDIAREAACNDVDKIDQLG